MIPIMPLDGFGDELSVYVHWLEYIKIQRQKERRHGA